MPKDVVVIGAGAAGSSAAFVSARAGCRVVCFSAMPDGRDARSGSTYSNQAWWHPGSLYYVQDPHTGLLLRLHGSRLFEAVGQSPPKGGGVYRFGDESAALAFETAARAMALASVKRLRNRESLGAYASEGVFLTVPDAPMAEAMIFGTLRKFAANWGARFENELVQLVSTPSAPNGYVIRTQSGDLRPDVTIVAAGAFTAQLLAPLGITVPLQVSRSPLLRIPSRSGLRVPLYIDRQIGLSVVRHIVSTGVIEVIGNSYRTVVDPMEVLDTPKASIEERQSILELLPSSLAVDTADWKVCYKTEALQENGKTTVRPWFNSIDGFPGLVVGVAGKATLGLLAGELLAQAAGIDVTTTRPTVLDPEDEPARTSMWFERDNSETDG